MGIQPSYRPTDLRTYRPTNLTPLAQTPIQSSQELKKAEWEFSLPTDLPTYRPIDLSHNPSRHPKHFSQYRAGPDHKSIYRRVDGPCQGRTGLYDLCDDAFGLTGLYRPVFPGEAVPFGHQPSVFAIFSKQPVRYPLAVGFKYQNLAPFHFIKRDAVDFHLVAWHQHREHAHPMHRHLHRVAFGQQLVDPLAVCVDVIAQRRGFGG